ncbi:MAG TPA: Asp-tRNA(Asn)/Glu-tRNA(Gln) amidotransferase subunit GatC [Pseudomonadales bacterium]
MAFDQTEVKKIAHLARLAIAEEDLEAYTRNMDSILGMVNQLQEVDTRQVQPMAHPLDAIQRLRKDIVTEKNQRDMLQSNAPAIENGLYLVPKVIE